MHRWRFKSCTRTLDGLLVENLEIMTKQYITLESANACLAHRCCSL